MRHLRASSPSPRPAPGSATPVPQRVSDSPHTIRNARPVAKRASRAPGPVTRSPHEHAGFQIAAPLSRGWLRKAAGRAGRASPDLDSFHECPLDTKPQDPPLGHAAAVARPGCRMLVPPGFMPGTGADHSPTMQMCHGAGPLPQGTQSPAKDDGQRPGSPAHHESPCVFAASGTARHHRSRCRS